MDGWRLEKNTERHREKREFKVEKRQASRRGKESSHACMRLWHRLPPTFCARNIWSHACMRMRPVTTQIKAKATHWLQSTVEPAAKPVFIYDTSLPPLPFFFPSFTSCQPVPREKLLPALPRSTETSYILLQRKDIDRSIDRPTNTVHYSIHPSPGHGPCHKTSRRPLPSNCSSSSQDILRADETDARTLRRDKLLAGCS